MLIHIVIHRNGQTIHNVFLYIFYIYIQLHMIVTRMYYVFLKLEIPQTLYMKAFRILHCM